MEGVIYIEIDTLSCPLPVSLPTTLNASVTLVPSLSEESLVGNESLPEWYSSLQEMIKTLWATSTLKESTSNESSEEDAADSSTFLTTVAECSEANSNEEGSEDNENKEEQNQVIKYQHSISLADTYGQNFSSKSSLIPLTPESITLLINSVLHVKISYGITTEDGNELSGESMEVDVGKFALSEILLGTPAADFNIGGVQGRFYVDDDVATFTLNSNALEICKASLTNLPQEWAFPVAPETPNEEVHTQLKEIVEGPLGTSEKQNYSINIEGVNFPPIKISGGSLTYTEPVSNVSETESIENDEKKNENEEEEIEKQVELGIFSLSWPDTGIKYWLPSDASKAMKESIVNNQVLNALVQWSGVKLSYDSPPAKGKGWVPDESPIETSLTSAISLQDFNTPGIVTQELSSTIVEAENSNFIFTMKVANPFVQDTKINKIKSLSELIPPRKIVPQRPPKDVESELQEELASIVNALTEEYVKLFIMQRGNRDMAFDDKRKRFFYSLNMDGLYHSLKEKLKPCIQRLARKKFACLPEQGNEQRDIMLAHLYSNLMENVAIAINKKVKEAEQKQVDELVIPAIDKPNNISKERFAELLMLAIDDENNERWTAANSKHEERLYLGKELAKTCYTAPEEGPSLVFEATEKYAQFSLRAPLTMKYRNQGIYLCREALEIKNSAFEIAQLYAASMLEEGSVNIARNVLEALVTQQSSNTTSSKLANISALLVLVGKKQGDKALMRKSLAEAVNAFSFTGSKEEVGLPRRTACAIMLQLGEYLLKYNLIQLSSWALEVYQESEKAALQKARERNFQPYTPVSLKVRLACCYAGLRLLQGDTHQAKRFGESAIDMNKNSGLAWLTLGNTLYSSENENDRLGACDAYKTCIVVSEKNGELITAQTFSRLIQIYLTYNKPTEAKAIALKCCMEYKLPTSWLNVGIAAYRLNEIEEAEEALQEGNTLDNCNPQIWGYLALVLLASFGQERLAEVSKCVEEALRHDIKDPLLLREISLAYISIDYLEEAERLLHRSLALDSSFHTRKVLVDVLSAQNLVDKAAKEYEIMLDSDDMDKTERSMVLEQYQGVLKVLGRDAEAESLPSPANWVS